MENSSRNSEVDPKGRWHYSLFLNQSRNSSSFPSVHRIFHGCVPTHYSGGEVLNIANISAVLSLTRNFTFFSHKHAPYLAGLAINPCTQCHGSVGHITAVHNFIGGDNFGLQLDIFSFSISQSQLSHCVALHFVLVDSIIPKL